MIVYSISDLSREFNITTRTIRHYEDIGLLFPQRQGKTRLYDSSDRSRLRLILRGKRLGLSLEESREIIDMYQPGKSNVKQLKKLIDAINSQKKKLNQKLTDITNLMNDLKKAEVKCLEALKLNGEN